MPSIKKDQIIQSKEVVQAFNDINEALKLTITNVDKLTTEAKKLKDTFANAKGIKEYTEAINKLNKNRQTAEQLTKQQIKLLQEEEKLKQQAARTTAAQERAIQSKNRTAEQERKISERQTKQQARLTGAYARQSKMLTLLRNRAKNLALTYGTTSKQFLQAEKRVVALDSKLKKLDARLGQSQRNVGNYGSSLLGVGKQLFGAFGIIGGVQLFAKALRSAFEISKKYEKQNAVLASVLGKTRKETKALQEQSKYLGSNTAFSATQVTELQTELARLGKTEDEILASTEGIIDATLALGSETGETAALVGATLNAFSKDASESSSVADVLTLSTQKSALSFEKLNTALPIASGAAAAAGVSFERMVAQLGQASDRGIDASTAATSLRNIYISLAENGLTLEQALTKINTSQDKLTTATELFGKRASVTALALADTIDKTDTLTTSLENAGGTAKQVAETQLNTLDGQLKLLNSAWEGLVLNINNSDTAIGGFSRSLIKFTTKALNQFANMGKEWELFKKSLIGGWEEADDELLKYIGTSSRVEDSNGNIRQTKDVLDEVADSYKNLTFEHQQYVDVNEQLALALLKAGADAEIVDGVVREYVKGLNLEKEALADLNYEYDDSDDLLDEQRKNKEELNEITKETIRLSKEEDERIKRQVKVDDLINKRGDQLKKEIEIQGEFTKSAEEGAKQLADFNISQIQRETDAFFESEQRKTDEAKRQQELRQEIANFGFDSALQISDALFENSNIRLQNEIQAELEAQQQRLNNDKLDAEQKEEIQKQIAEKEKELRIKQAEQEKKNSLFKIGIETAVGIARAVAASPLTFGLPFSAFVATQGAIQAALVSSRPIPQFDKGVENAPLGGFIAGEKRPEFIEHKGITKLVKEPTFFGDEFAGAKITSGIETATILENATRNDVVEHKDKDIILNIDYTNSLLKKSIVVQEKILQKREKGTNNFRMYEYLKNFSE